MIFQILDENLDQESQDSELSIYSRIYFALLHILIKSYLYISSTLFSFMTKRLEQNLFF